MALSTHPSNVWKRKLMLLWMIKCFKYSRKSILWRILFEGFPLPALFDVTWLIIIILEFHWESAARNWVLSRRTVDKSHDYGKATYRKKAAEADTRPTKRQRQDFCGFVSVPIPKASIAAAWSEKWRYISLSRRSYNKIQNWSHTWWFRPYMRSMLNSGSWPLVFWASS